MKKSGDGIIIEAGDGNLDENTKFKLMGYKLQKMRVIGITELADIIKNYDRIVAQRQDKMLELYSFNREAIETGRASKEEKDWYAHEFEELFGCRPFQAA